MDLFCKKMNLKKYENLEKKIRHWSTVSLHLIGGYYLLAWNY